MVHVPSKFWENRAMRFWVTVWKLNITDIRTDGRTDGWGAFQYPPSRAFGAAGDNKWKYDSVIHLEETSVTTEDTSGLFQITAKIYNIYNIVILSSSPKITALSFLVELKKSLFDCFSIWTYISIQPSIHEFQVDTLKLHGKHFQNLIVILISQNLFTCLKTLNFMFQGMSYVVRNHMSEKEYILH